MSISVTLFHYKVQFSIVALQGGQKWYHISFAGYVILNAHTPYPWSCCSPTGSCHLGRLLLLWRILDWAWEILLDFPLLFLHHTGIPLPSLPCTVSHNFDWQCLWYSSPIPGRANMSTPVSPCSSPLRQFKQSNVRCMRSPPHPLLSPGLGNTLSYTQNQTRRIPAPAISDPWLDVGQMKLQSLNISPKRFWERFMKKRIKSAISPWQGSYSEMFRKQLVCMYSYYNTTLTGGSVQRNGALEKL